MPRIQSPHQLAGIIASESFGLKWPVFRDSDEAKFLRAFLEYRIERARQRLECVESKDLYQVQAELATLKSTLDLLSRNLTSDERGSIVSWLKTL